MTRPIRCLIGWEQGANSGHLVRCLAIAKARRVQGHQVIISARNTRTVAQFLDPHRLPRLQALLLSLPTRRKPPQPPRNYAGMFVPGGYRGPHTLCARKVEEMGAGIPLKATEVEARAATSINRLLDDATYRNQAQGFAERHRDYNAAQALDTVIAQILDPHAQPVGRVSTRHTTAPFKAVNADAARVARAE